MENTLFADSERRLDREEPAPFALAWEIAGVVVVLVAIFLAVALVLGEEGRELIGPVGVGVSSALRFVFGKVVAYAFPALLGWFGVMIFLGKRQGWSPMRTLGAIMLLLAATGGLALPMADQPERRHEAFELAGAMGTFMVEWEGLRLVGAFGTLGAAMILASLGLAGLAMLTHRAISALVRGAVSPLAREKSPLFADSAILEEPTAPMMRSTTSFAPSAAPPEPAGEFDGDEGDLISGIFARRKKEALLLDPLPEERDPFGDAVVEEPRHGFDEDALSAARALEEARIDEEYERALLAERTRAAAPPAAEPPKAAPPEPAEASLPERVIMHGYDDAPRPVVSGNPANANARLPLPLAPIDADEDDDGIHNMPTPLPAALGDGLAKLFPGRHGKPLPAATPKSAEQVRDEDEDRALRRASAAAAPALDDPPFDLDDELELDGDERDSQDDPLFDERLETRPGGVNAALEAAKVSAVESEQNASAERRRALAMYRLPEVEILEAPPKIDTRMSREEVMEICQTLEKTFADFNIEVKVVEVKQGPVVTRFELKPAPGIKVSRIVTLEHDIAMAMKAHSVRIVAPIPGKAAVGIEIPNKNRQGVYLRELVSCAEFWEHPSPLAFALGKTIEGQPHFADLKKMPHLLIAGATGAGKSVCLNTILCSFIYRQRPDRLRMLMVDPKRVELSVYRDIPHLVSPVVCEPKCAAAALNWAVEQMEERYKKLVEFNVRNIDGYNEIVANPEKHPRFRGRALEHMPHLVVVVDEFADLMVVAKAEVEESIQRLAQMARAVGIHLILATQRPSVNVITGIIKANFPTRIAFQVSQKVDSRTILDQNGAETLLGRGDMLFAPAGGGKPIRLQGGFLSDEEVERIADHCRKQMPTMYDVEEFEPLLSEKEQKEMARLMGSVSDMDDLEMQDRMVRGTNKTMGKVTAGMFVPHGGGSAGADDDEIDEALVRAAARTILEARKGSTSLVQRRLKVGFARAGRLMDMLEQMGIVGPYKGSKPRDILIDCDAGLAQLDVLEAGGGAPPAGE